MKMGNDDTEAKERLAKGRIEGYKQTQDSQKHLTTLSAGSIVLIATFLSDIFPKAEGVLLIESDVKWLVAISFGMFAISIALSSWLLIHLPIVVERIGDIDINIPMNQYKKRVLTQLKYSFQLRYWTFVAFLLGMFSFGVAVLLGLGVL
jgi:hypothetical protein